MSHRRIVDHPVLGRLENRTAMTFTFDGEQYEGYEGDTIASALLASGIRKLRVHEESGSARGIYCNIGHCYECRVTVDQKPGVRACLTELKANMDIESGKVQPSPLKSTQNEDDLPRTYTEYIEKKDSNKEDDPHV